MDYQAVPSVKFTCYPDPNNPERYAIKGENLTLNRGGLLVDNLTKPKAKLALNAYQTGAILSGSKVSCGGGIL